MDLNNILNFAFKSFLFVTTGKDDATVFQIIYIFNKLTEGISFIITDQVLQILGYISEVILIPLKIRFFQWEYFFQNITSSYQ